MLFFVKTTKKKGNIIKLILKTQLLLIIIFIGPLVVIGEQLINLGTCI